MAMEFSIEPTFMTNVPISSQHNMEINAGTGSALNSFIDLECARNVVHTNPIQGIERKNPKINMHTNIVNEYTTILPKLHRNCTNLRNYCSRTVYFIQTYTHARIHEQATRFSLDMIHNADISANAISNVAKRASSALRKMKQTD